MWTKEFELSSFLVRDKWKDLMTQNSLVIVCIHNNKQGKWDVERENQSRISRKEFIWSHAIIDKRKNSLFLWAHLFFVSLNEISIRLDGAVNQRSILSITNGSRVLTWDRLTHAIWSGLSNISKLVYGQEISSTQTYQSTLRYCSTFQINSW